ncbi:hypothetical protein FRC03_001208 [Tulasnella sp. 419]|nr:hypothetical protein FRC02_005194 [Tulasnella sp. 418]KAG8964908.1 hypothetical protein FRC03_001208 [Tulasnella sp. 419]
MRLSILHRGKSHELSIDSQSTIQDLQGALEELTSVPPELQKILYKGKSLTALGNGLISLQEAGLKDGIKLTLMGSTAEEINKLRNKEAEEQRREDILQRRQARTSAKVRSTSSTSGASSNYRFHQIKSLPHLPNPSAAQKVLEKLALDPAIRNIMQSHQFSVGLLTELAPHEHPELLGLNENHGQVIRLRLRTDDYDGMRTYKEIRRVLCHELTHNVWGPHDDNFKELNSRLNREVAQFELSAKQGTHSLSSYEGPQYSPEVDIETEAEAITSHVLGGSSTRIPGGREELRAKMLEASLLRLSLEEKEIEERCGSDPSNST